MFASWLVDVHGADVRSSPRQTTVARVEVDTQADGRALVRWELVGTPAEHTRVATVAADRTSLVVTGSGSGRLFVSITPRGDGRDHAGVETYLTGPAGMCPADLRTLRERLVDPGG